MSSTAKQVHPMDILSIVDGYHEAINARQIGGIATSLTETAVLVADGIGVFEGRDAIIDGLRAYFDETEHPRIAYSRGEAVSQRAVRTLWTIAGSNADASPRMGEEIVFLDRDGFVEKVIVRDRTPANAA
ncbi:MAG: nuclear transport factor 2 family protein [Rhizobiaceae bacterium]|nr:nuclear transport factor 2 family protein [Rhizobiaceae bacterium]